MTDVTTYPNPHDHRFGGLSRRLLAPAPEHHHRSTLFSPHPNIFRTNSATTMDYQNQYAFHRPASTSGDRSVSVSSTASSASHHSPFRSESRALSPASVISEPASSILARSHQQLNVSSSHQNHHSYATHTPPPSMLLPGSSQYLQGQLGSQMSLYQTIPPHRVFGHQFPSSFNFQLNNVPPQPSPLSYQNYPPPLYPSYATASSYHDPSSAQLSSYHHHQQHHHQTSSLHGHQHDTSIRAPQIDTEFRLARLPPEVLIVLRKHVGYLESRKLLRLNRWFKDNFDANLFSDDEKVAGVHEAEQCFKRYYINSRNNNSNSQKNSNNNNRMVTAFVPAPSDSFACYHCYKMKSPENFELFTWHSTASREEREGAEGGGGGGVGGDESDSRRSGTPAAGAGTASLSSVPTTPTPRRPSLPTSNPYYDPTITRSSILQAQAAARNNSRDNRDNDRSNSPATIPTPSSTTGGAGQPGTLGGSGGTGPEGLSSDMGRVKSTWGIRRFCIDCGMKKKFYKPTDLIQVHGERGLVNWVCACLRVRVRSIAPSCQECGLHSRYEPPGGRRRGV